MKYVELTIHTTSEAEELVCDKLWEYTSYGVSVSNKNDILELIEKRRNTWDYLEDGVTENLNSNITLVKCYLDLDKKDILISLIERELFSLKENSKGFIDFGTLETFSRIVDGDDWIDIWRKHYRPMDMGKVVIKPEWVDYTAKENQIVVTIDSNMAFGTGEHETTSMCIDFLSMLDLKGKSVIDIGTGSGILGITAVKLGASKAVMTDIDEVAVNVAKHNAIVNKVEDKCLITLDNLLSGSDSVGDVVVANITADILIILSKDILSHLKSGSKLILSGILREKATEVIETYLPLGFKLINSVSKGEWVALMMEKL